jgi:type I restriction enzyme M protein
MLFIKYISDKYGGSDDFAPLVTIPKGASFKGMVALNGKSNNGDKINTVPPRFNCCYWNLYIN